MTLPSAHPVNELAEQLHRVLFEISILLCRRYLGSVQAGDLTLAQLSILMTLREHGPMRMTALAAHERVRTPTATVAIRRLVDLKLVVRSPDSTDLRGVLVRITPHGHKVCCDSLASRLAQLAAMLNALSPEDRTTLDQAMPPLERLASQPDA
jgi:DNA-binding MarR family transcriptional regulator